MKEYPAARAFLHCNCNRRNCTQELYCIHDKPQELFECLLYVRVPLLHAATAVHKMSGKQENLESVINLRILSSIYAECVSGDALRESYGQV